jgi:hypothetical protein
MEREGEGNSKTEGESDGKSMRTVVPSLIGAAKDSVTIRFPRKKNTFLFQLPMGYESGIEKLKGSGI